MSNMTYSEIEPAHMSMLLIRLMDSTSFNEFRDYFIRQGMIDLEYRQWKNDSRAKKNATIRRVLKSTPQRYATDLNEVLSTPLTVDEVLELSTEIENIQNTNNTPYDKVGEVITSVKKRCNADIKIKQHSQFRQILEQMLLNWTCFDIYNEPNKEISKDLVADTINIINKKQAESTDSWKHIWSLKRDAYVREPKDPDENQESYIYTNRNKLRHNLRKTFKNSEILITSSCFRHGYMYPNLSWSPFQDFMIRQYIFSVNEITFDKLFFKEWLSGYNWSTTEHSNKYDKLKTEYLDKWKELLENLVDQHLNYVFPFKLNNSTSIREYSYDYKISELNNFDFYPRLITLQREDLIIYALKKHPVLYLFKELLMHKHNISAEKIENIMNIYHPTIKNKFKMYNLIIDTDLTTSKLEELQTFMSDMNKIADSLNTTSISDIIYCQ